MTSIGQCKNTHFVSTYVLNIKISFCILNMYTKYSVSYMKCVQYNFIYVREQKKTVQEQMWSLHFVACEGSFSIFIHIESFSYYNSFQLRPKCISIKIESVEYFQFENVSFFQCQTTKKCVFCYFETFSLVVNDVRNSFY